MSLLNVRHFNKLMSDIKLIKEILFFIVKLIKNFFIFFLLFLSFSVFFRHFFLDVFYLLIFYILFILVLFRFSSILFYSYCKFYFVTFWEGFINYLFGVRFFIRFLGLVLLLCCFLVLCPNIKYLLLLN